MTSLTEQNPTKALLVIVRWLRQAHQIIIKLSDHHAILLTFYVADQAF